jgi:hypothetical protein
MVTSTGGLWPTARIQHLTRKPPFDTLKQKHTPIDTE